MRTNNTKLVNAEANIRELQREVRSLQLSLDSMVETIRFHNELFRKIDDAIYEMAKSIKSLKQEKSLN